MHRCFTGSTGAENLALAQLALSLEHNTPNAPMPLFEPSVHPVPISWLDFDSLLHQNIMASVLPTTIGCTGVHASVLPVLRTEELSGLTLAIFSLSSLEPKSLRMIILTIILVSLIALSIDHQNHSKWHKRCHVRYNLPPFWWLITTQSKQA